MKIEFQKIAGLFCLITAFSMAFYDYYTRQYSSSTPPQPSLVSLNFPLPQEKSPQEQEMSLQEKEKTPEVPPPVIPAPQEPILQEETLKINKGDTLLALLTGAGVPQEEAQKALTALQKIYNQKNLKAGQEVAITWEDSNSIKKLLDLTFSHDLGKGVFLKRQDNGDFQAEKYDRPLQKSLKKVSITIEGSLFGSALKKGIPAQVLNPLIQAFSYDIDFQRDIKRGDKLEIVFERFRDPQTGKERTGNALYAILHPQKRKPIQVYRFVSANKIAQYYNEKGESIRKALMRTPINGAKINSHFGKRNDPIHGFSRMHKGVDFRAPVGTPILAAGDGVIKKAAKSGGYGNTILLQHNGKYSTRYAHLSKFASGIRPGAKVKQGSVIGYVGKTGRATGAHLHFEVIENGVQINPNSIKGMSSGDKLLGKELKQFQSFKKQMEQDLKKLEKTLNIAAIDDLIPSKS